MIHGLGIRKSLCHKQSHFCVANLIEDRSGGWNLKLSDKLISLLSLARASQFNASHQDYDYIPSFIEHVIVNELSWDVPLKKKKKLIHFADSLLYSLVLMLMLV